MLELFFAVAFSAVPLTLYISPIRNLSRFLETVDEMWRETRFNSRRLYPRLRYAYRGFLNCLLCDH